MSHWQSDKAPEFQLEGRFLNFILKDGYKIRYLRLSTPSGEYVIKLSKEARALLGQTLVPGDWVQVTGSQKLDDKKGTMSFKAYQITKVAPRSGQPTPSDGLTAPAGMKPDRDNTTPEFATPAKATILVCQKSDCCKRGGRAVVQALETTLKDRNLADQVVIRGTGCMKRCKAGPNLVMPDKTKYSQIRPHEIPAVIDQHFQPTCAATVPNRSS